MKEIFEQYGGVIITVIAIIALGAIITALLSTTTVGGEVKGVVYDAFKGLMDNLTSLGQTT